ncbi:MAG: glycosyltransferase family 1 protein [Alphaproteobacteria bacterium]|nr:glycosyltransferase family 1 protein [Alphaproteobacteria bacterium SS10]
MAASDQRNIVFAYQNAPQYMPAPQYSARQVVIGPNTADNWHPDGRVMMLNTPAGSYDLGEVLAKLPKDQQPDLIIVKGDASGINLPVGFDHLDIPKVLIIGDTQHQQTPLRTMLRYANENKFDLLISDHKRHHLHYFIEAGATNAHWMPGLLVRDWQIPLYDEKHFPVTFAGQAGSIHPVRTAAIEAVQRAGIEIITGIVPQERAADIYGRSIVTLNPSLNGDLNLRSFEIPLSGGCAIADRLSPQSGQSMLFEEGKTIVTYNSVDELIERIRHYLSNPEEAIRISQQAQDLAKAKHSPAVKQQQFMELIDNHIVPDGYDGRLEKRSTALESDGFDDLLIRVEQYELFQEWHRTTPVLKAVATAEADPRLVCDLVDLHRLQIDWLGDAAPSLFTEAGVADQVGQASPNSANDADTLITGSKHINGEGLDGSLPKTVLLTDWKREGDQAAIGQAKAALVTQGYRHDEASCPGLFVQG